MRRRVAAIAFAVAAVVSGPVAGTTIPAEAGAGQYFDLSALPGPDFTGAQIWQGHQDFINAHPYRVTGTAMEVVTGMDLRDDMRALGYDTHIHSLPADPGVDAGPGVALKAIIATKRGVTKPDEWIVFTGHYDSVPQTIYGAYDNGSGTNLLRYLAREFANVQTNRSLVFVWFNGEEEGVLASSRYAKELSDAGQKIVADLGFDMEGIAYPVANPGSTNCLCMWYGGNDKTAFDPLLRYVNFSFLGLPNSKRLVSVEGINNRNSDESSFASNGFPTMRWAGMRTAAAYPAYHMYNDTLDEIVTVAGGASYVEQGIENTMKSAYYTALALDNHLPVPAATATTNGLSIQLDATGSSDEDGTLSTFSWDFGDGTAGTGSAVQHTYAAAGTYTVTLSVADNLWPTVTQGLTLQVTVA
ncbi:MAG: M28 family peptidase [Actinomycetota bacterium]